MSAEPENQKIVKVQGGGSDSVYGIGMIGAWVYYISRATTPRERVMGFLKGLAWPAFLVHDLFVFLQKEKPTAPAVESESVES